MAASGSGDAVGRATNSTEAKTEVQRHHTPREVQTTKGETMKRQATKEEKETVIVTETEIELEVEELEEVIAPGGGDPGLR